MHKSQKLSKSHYIYQGFCVQKHARFLEKTNINQNINWNQNKCRRENNQKQIFVYANGRRNKILTKQSNT